MLLLQTVKSLELCHLRVEMSEPKVYKVTPQFFCVELCVLCIFVGVGYTSFCSNILFIYFHKNEHFLHFFCSWGLNNLLYCTLMFHKEIISKAIKHTIYTWAWKSWHPPWLLSKREQKQNKVLLFWINFLGVSRLSSPSIFKQYFVEEKMWLWSVQVTAIERILLRTYVLYIHNMYVPIHSVTLRMESQWCVVKNGK